MSVSLTARFLERHIWGLVKSTKELVLTAIISAIILGAQYLGGGLTREAWRNNFWKEAYPLITVIAGLAIWHAGKAAVLLIREVEAQPSTKIVESSVLLPSGSRHSETVSIPPVPYLKSRVWAIALLLSALYALCAYLAWQKSKPAFVEVPPTPPPEPVSVYLGCDWDHIPIHIPVASTIHVIRLLPATLYGNPKISSVGVFEYVSSKSDKELDWPSMSEGRWMTRSEAQQTVISMNSMPTPFASRCTVNVYGAAIVEDLVATLIVDTNDKVRHEYPVAFDPFVPNNPFVFYVVNVCSSGVTVQMVQWADRATLHVLGEPSKRKVPLNFVKRGWPSELLPMFGPSSFLWNGVQGCHWDHPN